MQPESSNSEDGNRLIPTINRGTTSGAVDERVERGGDGIGNDGPDGKGQVVGQDARPFAALRVTIGGAAYWRVNANQARLLRDFGLCMQAGWADSAEREWQDARPFAALRVTIGGTAHHLNMEKLQTLRCAQGDKRIVLDFLGALNQ